MFFFSFQKSLWLRKWFTGLASDSPVKLPYYIADSLRRSAMNNGTRFVKGMLKLSLVRSTIFAPIQRLKLIMDEEQDTSYKSETHPRYHTRDMARFLFKKPWCSFSAWICYTINWNLFPFESGCNTLLRLQKGFMNPLCQRHISLTWGKSFEMKNRSIFWHLDFAKQWSLHWRATNRLFCFSIGEDMQVWCFVAHAEM